EQKEDRAMDLEEKAMQLAIPLLEMCLKDSSENVREKIHKEFKTVENWTHYLLSSGHALKKMQEIIKIQGGDPTIHSDKLHPGKYTYPVLASKNSKVKKIHSKNA